MINLIIGAALAGGGFSLIVGPGHPLIVRLSGWIAALCGGIMLGVFLMGAGE